MANERDLPQSSDRRTQDMQLLQILQETHRMAEDRRDDPGWWEIHQRISGVLARIGGPPPGGSTGQEPGEIGRIERTALRVSPGTADRVAADLMALADRPDDPQQVGVASDALAALTSEIG